MKFIGTKTHGYMDYIMGVLLIAAPWLFNFDREGAETWVPVVLGAGMILLALLTDYELGAARMVSMRTHLTIDIISGALLAVSPWLFGFADYMWAPHLILGILEIGAAICTKRVPSNERRGHHLHRKATAH
jgi:hypothetical protein